MTDDADATLLVRGTALPLPVDVRDDRLQYVMTATVGRPVPLRPGVYALEVPQPGGRAFRTVVTTTAGRTSEVNLPKPPRADRGGRTPRPGWTLEVISSRPASLHVGSFDDDGLALGDPGCPAFVLVTHRQWGRPTELTALALPQRRKYAVLARDGRQLLPGRVGRDDPDRAAAQLIEEGRLQEAVHLLAETDAPDKASRVLRGFLALQHQGPDESFEVADLDQLPLLIGLVDTSTIIAAEDSDSLALAAALYLRQGEAPLAAASLAVSLRKGPPSLSWAASALFEVIRDSAVRPDVDPLRLAALTRLVRHADLSRLHLTISGLPRDTLLGLLNDAWGLTDPRPLPLRGTPSLLARWLETNLRPMTSPVLQQKPDVTGSHLPDLIQLATLIANGAVRAVNDLLRNLMNRR